MTEENKQKYFNKEKQAKAIEWLNQKWPSTNRTCEICNSKSWTVPDDIVMSIQYTDKGLVLGGSTYPQIMAVCNSCGNTKYFNAVIAGLVSSTTKKEGEQDAK